jgi:hypothetical protein
MHMGCIFSDGMDDNGLLVDEALKMECGNIMVHPYK